MPRKSLAPWSEEVIEGVIDQPINSNIEADEILTPTVDTGFIDEKGIWKGRVSSDPLFHSFSKDDAIPNGEVVLQPSLGSARRWPLDMTNFSNLLIAIRPSNGGNYALAAVMGPDAVPFANLEPVDAAATLKGIFQQDGVASTTLGTLFQDNAEALTADVWNIFWIQGRLANQKLLQFKVTNNSGGDSNIELAFLRLV